MNDPDPTIGRRTATDPRQHVRLTAGFFTEPGKLGHLADPVERMATLGLLGASIGLCREQGTDGHIDPQTVLAATGLPPQYAKTLITDQMWHETDHVCPRCPQPRLGMVYVHDWLLHNPSAAQEAGRRERARANGARGGNSRWAGHQKPEKPQRGPGRPRRSPAPEPAAEPDGQLALVPIDPADTEPVLQHPAETLARTRRGRPRRTEPRVFDPIVVELCAYFADLRQRNDPDGKRDNITERWLNSCRLMIEVDGRKPEDIRKAITYCLNHEGHRLYVQSMPKLREDYGKLQNWAQRDLSQRAAAAGRRGAAPAAVAVSGMAGMLARQVGGSPGGMVKGA